MSWLKKYDEKVAKSIQDQLNITGITENAVFPKEKQAGNYRPKSLIDETLEYIDPTPNIFTLFVQFNEKFFWNKLLPVQVKWSPRMTSCAGICYFHPRNRECVISLSTPLLKLRPRKDLIETLLHEMIHAYLFLTNDNRDRDGHGPIFQSHMHRINKQAGTKITIYHTFHEEVKLYQTHWWRCNGPCQRRAPYFGMVKRAMNRAPGPNDLWWADHQATCGGQYVKIREPEKPEAKKKGQQSGKSAAGKSAAANGLSSWLKKAGGESVGKDPGPPKVSQAPPQLSKAGPIVSGDLKKLGNATNNVHGWGTAGPARGSSAGSGSSVGKERTTTSTGTSATQNTHNSLPKLSFSGTLGGSNTGRSNLLDKFADSASTSNVPKRGRTASGSSPKARGNSSGKPSGGGGGGIAVATISKVNCPICASPVEEAKINEHVDACLLGAAETSTPTSTPTPTNQKRKHPPDDSTAPHPNKLSKPEEQPRLSCPLCDKQIHVESFNDHLSGCVGAEFGSDFDDGDGQERFTPSSSSSVNLHDSPHHCLICDKPLDPNISLNDHLEDCVASVFDDTDRDYDLDTTTTSKVSEGPLGHIKLDKYPCPNCLTLVPESGMNQHLDICLLDNSK